MSQVRLFYPLNKIQGVSVDVYMHMYVCVYMHVMGIHICIWMMCTHACEYVYDVCDECTHICMCTCVTLCRHMC